MYYIIRASPEFQELVRKVPIQAEDLVQVLDRRIKIVPSAASPAELAEVVGYCEKLVYERLEHEKLITSEERPDQYSLAQITCMEKGEFMGPLPNQIGVFVFLDTPGINESSTTIERQHGNNKKVEKATPIVSKTPQQILLETLGQPREIVIGWMTDGGASMKPETFAVGDILILMRPEYLIVQNGTLPLIATRYMKQVAERGASKPSSAV